MVKPLFRIGIAVVFGILATTAYFWNTIDKLETQNFIALEYAELEESRAKMSRDSLMKVVQEFRTENLNYWRQSKMVREAFQDFNWGYQNISENKVPDETAELLLNYYNENQTLKTLTSFTPKSPAGRYLQAFYLAKRTELDPHNPYHYSYNYYQPDFENMIETGRCMDALLIEPEDGSVVYSFKMGVELGQNLLDSTSLNGSMFKILEDCINKQAVVNHQILNHPFYTGQDIAATAGPIVIKEKVAGYLVILYPES